MIFYLFFLTGVNFFWTGAKRVKKIQKENNFATFETKCVCFFSCVKSRVQEKKMLRVQLRNKVILKLFLQEKLFM